VGVGKLTKIVKQNGGKGKEKMGQKIGNTFWLEKPYLNLNGEHSERHKDSERKNEAPRHVQKSNTERLLFRLSGGKRGERKEQGKKGKGYKDQGRLVTKSDAKMKKKTSIPFF